MAHFRQAKPIIIPYLLMVIFVFLESQLVVNAHLAAFISSEGKPNFGPATRHLRKPSEPHSILIIPPSSSSTSNKLLISNTMRTKGLFQNEEDKPTFVPYIGPRVLANIRAYLDHLKENLEAMNSLEEIETSYEDYYGDNSSPRSHHRRHAPQTGSQILLPPLPLRTMVTPKEEDHAGSRTLSDKTPQGGFVLRRGAVSNYHPSWSYTKLGLGKRSGGRR